MELFTFAGVPYLRTSGNSPRYSGPGHPLEGTSWRNRPYSVGFFLGSYFGDELIRDRVDQDGSFYGGLHVGWDFDHYWGMEGRIGWTSPALSDNQNPPDERTADVFTADVTWYYYPWGDAAWRPYVLAGFGMASYDFQDDGQRGIDRHLGAVPLGAGLKYFFHPKLILRADVRDHIVFGDGPIETMLNLSVTVSLEYRFGGSRKSFYPWQPSRHIW